MLIVLLILQIILLGLMLLTTHMLEHKFKFIHKSLELYYNKRSYKTVTDINFIDTIINDYKALCKETEIEPDLESAIRVKLQQEYIGRFKYSSVKNTATQIRYLMLIVCLASMLVSHIDLFLTRGQALIVIATTFLLAVVMYIYGTLHNLESQQNQLIDSIIDYIKNIYPIEKLREQKKQEQLKEEQKQKIEREKQIEEERKIIELNLEQEEKERLQKKEQLEKKSEQELEKKVKASGLTAHDISQLLKNL